MKHAYKVEHIGVPSITVPNSTDYIFQITYSKNGNKEKPMTIHTEEYAYTLIQEFLRGHKASRVIFRDKDAQFTPIGLVNLERRVESLRADMEKGIFPPPMNYNITTSPTVDYGAT